MKDATRSESARQKLKPGRFPDPIATELSLGPGETGEVGSSGITLTNGGEADTELAIQVYDQAVAEAAGIFGFILQVGAAESPGPTPSPSPSPSADPDPSPSPSLTPSPSVNPTPAPTPSGEGSTEVSPAAWIIGREDPTVESTPSPSLAPVPDEPVTEPEPVTVTVDATQVAGAAGGDLVGRLKFVLLPECAVETPEVEGCTEVEVLPTKYSSEEKTLSAEAPSGSTMALASSPEGTLGSFKVSDLSSSAFWSTDLGSGSFGWSYGFDLPDVPGGLVPDLTMRYSSGSVDGKTASTNNQATLYGEGHDVNVGYVERKYIPCAADMTGGSNSTADGNLCWDSDNQTLVFGGEAEELLKVQGSSDEWRKRRDDGTRVQRIDGPNTNGDNNGEYWLVTTTDGTKYYFGLNTWANNTAPTNSVAYVAVAGNHAGEPCRASTYATSFCNQAWRWSLDRVVDPSGNTITYRYWHEYNYYWRSSSSPAQKYVRSLYPVAAEYGTRTSDPNQVAAPVKVAFEAKERCVGADTDCDPGDLNSSTASRWPDVPFDQICSSTPAPTSCSTNKSPTFFTRKRIVALRATVHDGSTPEQFRKWNFTQSFPSANDGFSQTLWLGQIKQEGAAPSADDTSVGFGAIQLQNRVGELNDGFPELTRFRVDEIHGEAGSKTTVTYTDQDCSPSSLPSSPDTNTRRCYPVDWTMEGDTSSRRDWFHKYVTKSVTESDPAGGGPAVVTQYGYNGGGAWRHDETPGTPGIYRTWNQWRGYATVNETRGDSTSAKQYSTYLFLRGMHSDRRANGTTKTVIVYDSFGGQVTDHDHFQGFLREKRVWTGPGGSEVLGELHTPWLGGTATGVVGHQGWLVAEQLTQRRTPTASGPQITRVQYTRSESDGLVEMVEDLGGPGGADDLCTRTNYNRNTTEWIVDRPYQVKTTNLDCATPQGALDPVVSDVRTYYDGATSLAAVPTKGQATKVERLKKAGWNPTYEQVARFSYDAHGRVTHAWDGFDRETVTTFSPAVGHAPQTVTVTNPAGQQTVTTLNRFRGLVTSQIDVAGRRTDATWDSQDRLSAVWLPGQSKSAGDPATQKFTYHLVRALTGSQASPYAASSRLLNDGTYATTYQIFDSLFRPRQSQNPAADGSGRVITETKYDSRGLAVESTGAYATAGAPVGERFAPIGALPATTKSTIDGAGRPTKQAFFVDGVEKWHTATTYNGERTRVDPPQGAVASTSIVDARGRTTELQRHKPTTGGGETNESILYEYSPAGELAKVTDPGGNIWTYEYDLAGRTVRTVDPDKGESTFTFNVVDQQVTSTDAAGKTLWNKYDSLGRKTEQRLDNSTGTLRAAWVYDTIEPGQLTSSTSYDAGNAYKSAVTGFDAAGRPTGSKLTIPAGEGTLAGDYTSALSYNLDGTVATQTLPAAPGLPAETLSFGYTALGAPKTLGGQGTYVTDTSYTPFGELAQIAATRASGKTLWQTYTYETGTRRLIGDRVDRQTQTNPDLNVAYAFDPAGNIRSALDTGTAGTDRQCFEYDWAARLTQAFTASAATCPNVTSLGDVATGANTYWHSWTYDAAGNRAQEIIHAQAGDTTRTYAYDDDSAHAVSQVVATGATTGTDTYQYDATGNLIERDLAGQAAETYAWTPEGRLDTSTDPADDESTYVYGASGERFLRRTPDGTTLFVGETQITTPAQGNGPATSVRHYTHAGKTIATRTSSGVTLLATDRQDTPVLETDANLSTVKIRRSLPFGNPRGNQPTFTAKKAYVGGTNDESTEYTHLGAREYDPTTGRFISVDPLIDLTDPTQMGGYAYANHSPITLSDPTGLEPWPWRYGDNSEESAANAINSYSTYGGGGGGGVGSGGGGSSSGNDESSADSTQTIAINLTWHLVSRALAPNKKNMHKVAEISWEYSGAADCTTNFSIGWCVFGVGSTVASAVPGGQWAKGIYISSRLSRFSDEAVEAGIAAKSTTSLADEATGLLGSADDVVVLGRQADTAVANGWDGHVVLNTPNWSLELNDAFIRGAIDQGRRIYLASPTKGNLIQTSGRFAGQPTVYARELQMLRDAGYTRSGDYMVPR